MEDVESHEMHERRPQPAYNDYNDDDDNGDESDEWDSSNSEQDEHQKQPMEDADNYNEDPTVGHDGTHQVEHNPAADVAETSFNDEKIDKEALERIINLIEDGKLRDNVNFTIDAESDEKGAASGKTLKNALIDGISDLNIEDRLDNESWEAINKKINLKEHEKFEYNQKVKVINEALENVKEDNFFINPEDDKLFNFLQKFEPELSDKKKELKGFNYNGKEIIRRKYINSNDKKKGFKFEFLNNETADQVIDQLDDITKTSFKNQLISKIGDTKNIKTEAENYMEELRSIQKEKVKNATKIGELKEKIRQINKTNEDIEKIKENQPIVINENVLETSLKGRTARFLKKYKVPVISAAVQGIFSVVGSILTTIGVDSSLHKAGKKVAKLGSMITKTGKVIEKIGKTMNNLTKYPVDTIAAILKMFGYMVKETSQNPVILALLLLILSLIYIIKRWRGR